MESQNWEDRGHSAPCLPQVNAEKGQLWKASCEFISLTQLISLCDILLVGSMKIVGP